MKISIALCTYNGERFLPEFLNSITTQTHQPYEMVVYDDVSSDRTLQILESYAKDAEFPVRIVQNETNLGTTHNFEKAISSCKGDVIALADQDDIWHEQKLELFAQAFNANIEVGLVFSDLSIIGETGIETGETMWQRIRLTHPICNSLKGKDAFKVLLKKNYITGAATAFRTDYRDIVLPISSRWVHDGWIAIIIAAVASLALLSEPTVYYRQHDSNQIGAYQKPFLQRARNALNTRNIDYLQKSQVFSDLLTHLQSIPSIDKDHISLLESKVEHFRKRANLPKLRVLRLPTIIRELVAGNYRQFSVNGLGSALRDFLAQ